MKVYGAPQPRAAHLYATTTSRDLFGIVRSKCFGCKACGRYIINTQEKYTKSHQSKQGEHIKHPDNDVSITYCSRCGCPPEHHEEVRWETEREAGSDAYQLQQWDSAILHYTKAIEEHPVDAALYTNRAAAFLSKGWYSQALHDAERAVSLRPQWFRSHSRRAAALVGLGRHGDAIPAFVKALQCCEEENIDQSVVLKLQQGLEEARKKEMQKMQAAENDKTTMMASNQPRVVESPLKTPSQTPRPDSLNVQPIYTHPTNNTSTIKPSVSSLDRKTAKPPHTANDTSPSVFELVTMVEERYDTVVSNLSSLKEAIDQLRAAVYEGDPIESHDGRNIVETQDPRQPSIDREVSPMEHTFDADIDIVGSISQPKEEEENDCSRQTLVESDASTSNGHVTDDDIEQQDPVANDFIHIHNTAMRDTDTDEETETDEDEAASLSEWLEAVEAARQQLGVDATSFVPPPPTSKTYTNIDNPKSFPNANRLDVQTLEGLLLASNARRQRTASAQPTEEEIAYMKRQRRIQSAQERKRRAEEEGDLLQKTQCDVVTHAVRGPCSACTSCTGFCIMYRSIDATDPEVMFYCSLCGCRADCHPVDKEWAEQEEKRRHAEAEAAAGARRAAAARSSAGRNQELEAYTILGLHYGADSKAVARAYKRLALVYHPDKVAGRRSYDKEGESAESMQNQFVKITRAYQFLCEHKNPSSGFVRSRSR